MPNKILSFEMSEHIYMNALLYDFIVVVLLSLVIGLEQRRHHMDEDEGSDLLFGTDRTFTFIGIFGFVLFQLDTINKVLFMAGGAVIAILLAVFYKERIAHRQKYGLTSIISALITYCLSPMVITLPKWFTLLVVVTVLILTEVKSVFFAISKKFDKDEFITLAKFIVIAFIILPNLPTTPISPKLPLSLYDLWLALVVVSGISYVSYLLRKFFFKNSGIIITGVLGGLYSSTAVTLLLSKKSREKSSKPHEYATAIISAIAVMYIRVFLLLFIFNKYIAAEAFVYLAIFFVVTFAVALFIYRSSKSYSLKKAEEPNSQNPLEFKMGLLFMFFYLLFSFLSQYAVQFYGNVGIHMLAFLAGFADVDAFVINLAQGNFTFDISFSLAAVLLVTTSNNIVKMIYSIFLSEKEARRLLIWGFGVVIVVNLVALLFLIAR